MTTRTPAARTTDPTTSHAAAASVNLTKSEQVRAALVYLFGGLGPMTDETIAEAYAAGLAEEVPTPYASPSGLRTRRAELVIEGRVVDTGTRARLASGRRAIVWALA